MAYPGLGKCSVCQTNVLQVKMLFSMHTAFAGQKSEVYCHLNCSFQTGANRHKNALFTFYKPHC